jgi:hypothetical protein
MEASVFCIEQPIELAALPQHLEVKPAAKGSDDSNDKVDIELTDEPALKT